MPVENAEIARLFRQTADLLELKGENPFRIRAYQGAARTVDELPGPVEELIAKGDGKRLTKLPGIGADLAGKIEEIVHTGTFSTLAQLERKVPKGLTQLVRVRGLGPKRARALYDRLGIHTLAQLERACRSGKIAKLRGFGVTTQTNILRELLAHRTSEARMLRPMAAQYGETLLRYLRATDGVSRAEIAGSYRRRKDTVGDLDILVTCQQARPVVQRFVTYPEVSGILAEGPTRASVRLRSGLQVDLRVLSEECYGAGLYYFTGSKAHNIAVRRLAQRRGLRINEYGVWRGKRRIAGRTEEEVLGAVGLPWILPELREKRGEIEAALAGTLPRLVESRDIRGDLQCHTTDSDGRNTLSEMTQGAAELGYEYLAVTDHSPAVRVAGGLDRAGFRRQMRRIDRLNAKSGTLTLLKGAEVDIHADGTLDLDDDTLATLDLVVISVHSAFDLSEREQTKRLLRAVRHPSVDILGHPTSRLIGHREGIRFDREQVYRAAAEHGVLLEVNSQPDRLDLDDLGIRAAIGFGATLAISTDAHAVPELGFMRWGVDQARRGWAETQQIANTRSLAGLLELLHRGRQR
jgi:DNA polymerase (family 10)